MANLSRAVLSGDGMSAVVDIQRNSPQISYLGKALHRADDLDTLKALNQYQAIPAAPAITPAVSLCPSHGEGFVGQIGIQVHREGKHWGFYPSTQLQQLSNNELLVDCHDKHTQIALRHRLVMDTDSGVLTARSELINHGESDLQVNWCAAPTLPVANKFTQLIGFEGRWAKEFQQHKMQKFCGVYLRENRKGKTSHDSFPALVLTDQYCSESQGEALAFHLGFSGNHRLCAEELHDGRSYVQAGELLLHGEIILAPGASYTTPTVYCSYSSTGLNGIRHNFHRFVRSHLLADAVKKKPRPVHFNTWEAVYFEHNTETLKTLAAQAAELGAERFILDDGWFNGRRNDRAGLGDWFVDRSIYPQGLTPLINEVTSLGMEFGLWFEPEMVNPNSALFRAHPDWVLGIEGAPTLYARQQLVLNLAKPEVAEYLFERIDALLREYNITYIKWDMNRDLHQPADEAGRACVHRQTYAVYKLIERIRTRHPKLEIESCASGGGRADYGILQYTDRVWTSDSNDALDRLSIQKGFSLFFPAEIMGAHVGPAHCHITGRRHHINLRAGVALFGHMGMEVDIINMPDEEKHLLKRAIALHKRYRHLIHTGLLRHFSSDENSQRFAVYSQDEQSALFAHATIASDNRAQLGHYYFYGLCEDANYQLSVVWPAQRGHPLTEGFAHLHGKTFAGELLALNGLQLPPIPPESMVVFAVEKK